MKSLYLTKHFSMANEINLTVETLPKPVIGANECLIKVAASGINSSDALGTLGYFANAHIPRIPGRDFSGVIVEGPQEYIGQKIWGSGGAAGVDFDGTHTEFIKLPLQAIAVIPKNMDLITAAGQTLPFLTAYYGLVKRAQIQAGETILITGALGQVGKAATTIALWKKCSVVALVRGAQDVNVCKQLGIKAVDSNCENLSEQILNLTHGQLVSVIFNSIGNQAWAETMKTLAPFGRHVIIGAANEDTRIAPVHIFNLFRANQNIIGVNSVPFNYTENAALLNELKPGFEAGSLIPLPAEKEFIYPLNEATAAYKKVLSGSKGKRVILKISE